MNLLLCVAIFGLTLSVIGIVWVFDKQIVSDEGRLGRDLSSKIGGYYSTDDEVRGYWCAFLDFSEETNTYRREGEKEYCGDTQVTTSCIFTNKGDHCLINAINSTEGGRRS